MTKPPITDGLMTAQDFLDMPDDPRHFVAELPPDVKLTWESLVGIEPRLADLLADANAVTDEGGNSFCANAVWYGYGAWDNRGLKDRLCNLVGWDAESREPVLHTSEAYSLAYRMAYNVLPDCRNCICM